MKSLQAHSEAMLETSTLCDYDYGADILAAHIGESFSPSPIDDDNAMGCEVVPFDALRGIDVWKLSGKV